MLSCSVCTELLPERGNLAQHHIWASSLHVQIFQELSVKIKNGNSVQENSQNVSTLN
jgi:hypothetical protein